MSLVALPRRIPIVPWSAAHAQGGPLGSGLGSSVVMTFNAAGDKVAVIFQAPSSEVPDALSFYVDSVSVAGSAGDIELTLETLDSSGNPSGTPVTNSATGTATISTTGVKTISGTDGTASVTVGDFYALVLTAGSGWNRTLTIFLTTGASQGASAGAHTATKDSAGAWLLSGATNSGWCFGVAGATNKLIVPGFIGPFTSCALQAFSDSTNPDERGNRFSLEHPATIFGCSVANTCGSAPDSGEEFTTDLYTDVVGSPSSQMSVAIDPFKMGGGYLNLWLQFDAPVDLDAGTVYGLALKAAGAGNQNFLRYDYDLNASLAWHCGTSFYSITRNNSSGAFTADDAKVYAIYPVFSRLDDGTGGSGGGMRMAGHGGLAA